MNFFMKTAALGFFGYFYPGCLRVLRASVVIGSIFFVVGCVPYRQGVREGRSPAAARTGASDPKAPSSAKASEGKLAGDAWKSEMEGLASWYGEDFHGRLTASGEVYDMYKYTAAHKTLPLGTVVKVRNLENGKETEVRINDRGPYVSGRIIDLSRTAGRALEIRGAGLAKVRLEVKKWPR